MQVITQPREYAKDAVVVSGTIGPLALAFHRMIFSTIIVDVDCRVLCISDSARNLLNGLDGLRIEGGILVAAERAADVEMQHVLDLARQNRMTSDYVGAIPILRPQRLPIILYVVPAMCSLTYEARDLVPAAALYLYDPIAPRKIGTLAHHFRLTPPETDLIEAILAGRSVLEVARGGEASPDNAQSHLKAIYGKTGARSFADLARLFALEEETGGAATNPPPRPD